MDPEWDCIVIGGGAAGLSAALVLGRARQRTLLVDSGGQSNLPSPGIGGLLGHDGRPPAELYALGRRERARYGSVVVVDGRVEDAQAADGDARFRVELEGGEQHLARFVVLATGMDYTPVALPGVAELWGGAVFHCPFCHGWEHSDQRLGVLSDGPHAVQQALLLRTWTDDVVLLGTQPPDHDEEALAGLEAAGVVVEPRPAVRLLVRGSHLDGVELADGSVLPRDGLLVGIAPRRRVELAVALGARLDEAGVPVVDGFGRTSVPGLLACGDASAPMPQIATAIAEGSRAAAAVVHDRLAETVAPAGAPR